MKKKAKKAKHAMPMPKKGKKKMSRENFIKKGEDALGDMPV